MSENALDFAKRTLVLWNRIHPGLTLDQFCQRFSGYYWSWAFQGNENIVRYDSAHDAAKASHIESTDINSAPVGAYLYWSVDKAWHVGNVIGHDNGRTLVVYATRFGDTVMELGNGVKVSHADTYAASHGRGAAFYGWSLTNGKNAPTPGLAPYDLAPHTAPAGAPAGDKHWATNPPSHAVQKRIQIALKKRGRYAGLTDGEFGINSWKGIQTTVKNVGYVGAIDGVPGERTCHFIQVYAAKFGGYRGAVDSILGPNSWEGFARGLEAGLR